MNDGSQLTQDEVIRISRSEALGRHADELLIRQQGLRGLGGGHGAAVRRHWYYSSWFVLMMAGGLGALVGWGLIEPNFSDSEYYQGTIEALEITGDLPGVGAAEMSELAVDGVGHLQVRGIEILLLGDARVEDESGTWAAVPLEELGLSVGSQVGLYVEAASPEGDRGFSRYVVLDPPPQPPELAARTLNQGIARGQAASLLFFAVIAGLIGLAIGMADGVICRVPRRVILGGGVGLIVGFVGGFLSSLLAGVVYTPLNAIAMDEMATGTDTLTTYGFAIQTLGRSLAWALAGTTMGLAQGLVLRSRQLLLYGFIGGTVGGLLGGLLFDPIDLLLFDQHKPSAHVSRMVGTLAIGMIVGLMIGVVELLARDSWLRMVEGPLRGKEFLIFKDVMKVGSQRSSDIFLFNDDEVSPHHATIRSSGGTCEIEGHIEQTPVLINGRPESRARLRHGDRIRLGATSFIYEQRAGR